MRLGTTSYILPDEILPNVRFLAPRLDDVELVMFEVDDGTSNLVGPDEVDELAQLAAENKLSYTVHLPLDLRLGTAGGEQHRSLRKAQAVIERTRPLNPLVYVLHLDGKDVSDYEAWVAQAATALELAAKWAGGPERLAVENLEGYPLDFIDPVVERAGASRCVDIGHLWLDGHDPVPYLEQHLERTRVIHLHGIDERDHQSVAHMGTEQIDAVAETLRQAEFDGVLTIEVFNLQDLESSLVVLQQAGIA